MYKKPFSCWPWLLLVVIFPLLSVAQSQHHFISHGKQLSVPSFDEEVQKIMDDVGIPAMSVAIMDNNSIVYTQSYGFKRLANKEKVDAQTVFEACSLSKVFLVYVVWKLADARMLDLDKPMYQYMEYEALKHDDRYKKITPRMIIAHCSGLENWAWLNTREKLELLSDPGTQFTYSGEGFHYLAKVVEGIVHAPYEKYIDSMVLQPLGLKNTYLKFTPAASGKEEFPSDYAIGHNNFGKEIDKWKNTFPVPASAIHTNAADYAKLIIALFDPKNFSADLFRNVLKPVVTIREEDPPFKMSAGFGTLYLPSDTIISYGGDNDGFKAQLFYSVMHKRGFVFFTNSDRGETITQKMASLSNTSLAIQHLFQGSYFEQYPSNACILLKIYRQQGAAPLLQTVDQLHRQQKLNSNTLNELGELFVIEDKQISKKLLEKNIAFFPDSSLSYYMLGKLQVEMNDYTSAFRYFTKAKALRFNKYNVDHDLQLCTDAIKDAARRQQLLVTINDTGLHTIEAENYNAMSGVRPELTADTGGGENIGNFETGDWTEYKINVHTPGLYTVSVRAASLYEGRKLQLTTTGTSKPATIEIPSTNGWQTWGTFTSRITLPAGVQTLRLSSLGGGLNVNWIRFSREGIAKQ